MNKPKPTEGKGIKEVCGYCKGIVCNGDRKTIAEWNKCPWHRADWETNTNFLYWLFDIFTFGLARHFIFEYKLKKYSV